MEKRLKELQCATRDAKLIYEFERQQLVWLEVENAISKAVEKRRGAHAPSRAVVGTLADHLSGRPQ